MAGQKPERTQKGEEGKEHKGEADPVGDCTGSAGEEEKGMGRESGESHREMEGKRRRGEGGGGPRDQGPIDLLTY